MSARSKARKQSLDLLYEADIRGTVALEILESRDIEEVGPEARPIREYTKELISGISEHSRKIDELISTYAQGWDMDRLPAVDRNILRLGIFELLWGRELTDSIIIDEALTLAKDLSTEESPPDVFHSFFSYKRETYNGNLTNFEFNNCKMLVDIGDIKEGMEFKNIIVSVEIIPLPEFISEKMENKNIENEMEPSIIYYV